MRTTYRMQDVTDSAGWTFSMTVFGVIVASHWLAQLATSILTLVVCMVVAHFLKLLLNHYWPQTTRKRSEAKPDAE